MFIEIIFIISLLNSTLSYPYFPECSNLTVNSTILNTLNGKIKGACYDVTVNYGSKNPETSQVLTWLSIPYAQPPVGSLRFKEPLPIKSWSHVVDGTQWPNMCIQPGLRTKKMSEDCLYLNLFVPYNTNTKNSSNKYPIYLHVHGGSLRKGSSVDDRLEPSTLVALSNVIVVTINYRLGPLGFLYINGTESRGNQGLLDQNLALKWVYENAHLFGGDNTQITIGGQSSGSLSIGYHLIYKPSWPFFKNAILQSGDPLEGSSKKFLSTTDSTKVSFKIGNYVRCNSTANNELFNCLQTADVNKLTDAYTEYNIYPPLVSNGIDFSDDPENLFKSGDFKRGNILTGSNTKERAYFIQSDLESLEKKSLGNLTFVRTLLKSYFNDYPIERHQPTIKTIEEFLNNVVDLYLTKDEQNNKTGEFLDTYIQILTDARYKCPAYELAEIFSNFNQTAYVYLYGHHLSTSEFPKKYEAVHGDELAMIFAEPLSVKIPPLITTNPWSSTRHNYSVSERLISEKIAIYWTNFVKYDNPNGLNEATQDWSRFKINSSLRKIEYLNELPFENLNYDKINDAKCAFFQI